MSMNEVANYYNSKLTALKERKEKADPWSEEYDCCQEQIQAIEKFFDAWNEMDDTLVMYSKVGY